MTRRIALAVTALAAVAGITLAAVPAHAGTVVNWRQRTCSAFTAWDAHRTPGRLTTLVTDSTHLGKSYLKADVGQLYADASSPSKNAWKYLSVSEQYVSQDCFGGA